MSNWRNRRGRDIRYSKIEEAHGYTDGFSATMRTTRKVDRDVLIPTTDLLFVTEMRGSFVVWPADDEDPEDLELVLVEVTGDAASCDHEHSFTMMMNPNNASEMLRGLADFLDKEKERRA